MTLKFLGAAAILLAIAGCADQTSQPITEEIFTTPANTAPPAAIAGTGDVTVAPIAAAPLGPDGQPMDPALAMVEENPYGEVVQTGSGLTERLPDTCKLADYQIYMGQSGGIVEASGLSAPYRVIRQDAIISQEYNPTRVNFYLDGSGNVNRIICG